MLNRRALLVGAGAIAIAATAGPAAAQRAGTLRLRGTVRYGASGALPAGVLTVRLEEQGIMDKPARRIAAATRVRSHGRRRAVSFELNVPRSALDRAIDPGFSVRLERNGRLIAINTTRQRYRGGRQVSLTIDPILY